MLKIVIPSYNRAETLTTPRLLEAADIGYSVLVHNAEQHNLYVKAQRVPKARLVVTQSPAGVTYQRQWAEDYLIHDQEWYLSLDDNIRSLTRVALPWYNENTLPTQQNYAQWRDRYQAPLLMAQLVHEIVPECLAKCEQIGSNLCGFAFTDNAYFRGKKWLMSSPVIGRMFIRRKVGVRWDHEIQNGDDFDQTLAHLARDGCVLVNNYVFRDAPHYQLGGLGTRRERMRQKAADTAKLIRKWPKALRKKMKGHVEDVTFSLRANRVERWRDGLKQQEFWDGFAP